MEHTSIINKIRKILNLTKSSNEHEAAAAAAKAQELLSQYNLSLADIDTSDEKVATSATTASARTRQRLERWAYDLAEYTADAFDCGYWHQEDVGKTIFAGVGADPEVCSWTYSYLYKTLLRMGSAYLREKCTRLRSNKSKREARASYLQGVVGTVGIRLSRQKQQSPITESALVPVKQQAIQDAMPTNLHIVNFKPTLLRDRDLNNGLADGANIPLSTPMSGREPSAAIG